MDDASVHMSAYEFHWDALTSEVENDIAIAKKSE